MPITQIQKAQAERHQWTAAQANGPQVRLVAGPGTGKTSTIEKRVSWLLNQGVQPANLYVISFTRASCAELQQRIARFCGMQQPAGSAARVRVSTMHSLALRILRRANLLSAYPTSPILLDDWEQENIYDSELATALGSSRTRAREIRIAHDAQWQTLSPQAIAQAQITQTEIQGFNAFHAARSNLYSCVLPGEVIFRCVEAFRQGALQQGNLPQIDHLIVDEYQDLNACDQEFICLLSRGNTVLFVAGDDDQSIYSFRHADPTGIVRFDNTYPNSTTHSLAECFRCTPAVLTAADRLIRYNPQRIPKTLTALYASATPPVHGQVLVWQLPNPEEEARAIADSCRALVDAGMAGREDEILILISSRRLQLSLIGQELRARNLPYDAPSALAFADEFEGIRAVYSIIRILRNLVTDEEDYPAYRDLLGLLSGVGQRTAQEIGDECINHNQNFRALFHGTTPPAWLGRRASSAVQRVMSVVRILGGWTMAETLSERIAGITALLSTYVFTAGTRAAARVQAWTALSGALPPQMTLEELLLFLGANTEAEQESILDTVASRIARGQDQRQALAQKKIRMLTMHGSKGLTASVVFIPSVEQGIMPNRKALQATGLLIEQRRLFYVALTRTRACCIVSHSACRSGFQSQAVAGVSHVRLPRSQFLNEMGISTVQRTGGLTQGEAQSIVNEVNNL
jgi:DNA helicase-2/ATP-dependent DNA helicase PcrA